MNLFNKKRNAANGGIGEFIGFIVIAYIFWSIYTASNTVSLNCRVTGYRDLSSLYKPYLRIVNMDNFDYSRYDLTLNDEYYFHSSFSLKSGSYVDIYAISFSKENGKRFDETSVLRKIIVEAKTPNNKNGIYRQWLQ